VKSTSKINWVFRGIYYLQALLIAVASSLAGASQADPAWIAEHAELFVKPHHFLLQWVWLAWILTLLIGVLEIVRRKIGSPWVWQCIHDILDAYKEKVFEDSRFDRDNHHRVTLFQHKKFTLKWWFIPKRGWLVPVERSGWTNRKRRTWFRAPDDADKAEGIAGMIWAMGKTLTVEDLPEINKKTIIMDRDAIANYAKQTWVRENWVRNRLNKGYCAERSFCGFPIENKGKPWGVLVLSSRSPEALANESIEVFDDFVVTALSSLLERKA